MKKRNRIALAPILAAERVSALRRTVVSLTAVLTLTAVAALVAFAADQEAEGSSAAFVKEIPPGYRDWKLISVAHEEGTLNDIRAILGNDVAVNSYREGKLPFPEGAIIARLAWEYLPSEENNKVFGRSQSFVAGHPTNGVQFMVKDSKRYAATGGWGYAHFENGKPATEAFMQSCFPCHREIKSRDFIFTRYSP
jgi:hypothetical protein